MTTCSCRRATRRRKTPDTCERFTPEFTVDSFSPRIQLAVALYTLRCSFNAILPRAHLPRRLYCKNLTTCLGGMTREKPCEGKMLSVFGVRKNQRLLPEVCEKSFRPSLDVGNPGLCFAGKAEMNTLWVSKTCDREPYSVRFPGVEISFVRAVRLVIKNEIKGQQTAFFTADATAVVQGPIG